MGSPSENIRLARARSGLEVADVARAARLSRPSYYDLETYDDEVTGNISLDTLRAIARTLGTTTVQLLEGQQAAASKGSRSPSVLVDLARARISSEGLSVDAYSERIGWDMVPVLENPEHVWKYPFDMLRALCRDLAVDWTDFVGELEA